MACVGIRVLSTGWGPCFGNVSRVCFGSLGGELYSRVHVSGMFQGAMFRGMFRPTELQLSS